MEDRLEQYAFLMQRAETLLQQYEEFFDAREVEAFFREVDAFSSSEQRPPKQRLAAILLFSDDLVEILSGVSGLTILAAELRHLCHIVAPVDSSAQVERFSDRVEMLSARAAEVYAGLKACRTYMKGLVRVEDDTSEIDVDSAFDLSRCFSEKTVMH